VKKQPKNEYTKSIEHKDISEPKHNRQQKRHKITAVKAFALGLGRNDVAFTLSLFAEAVVGERGTVPPAGLIDLVTFPLEVEPGAGGAPLEIVVPAALGVLTVVFALIVPPLKGGMS
jgi:hypothetical protein